MILQEYNDNHLNSRKGIKITLKYPIITLTDVSLAFDGKTLFSKVNISIYKGEKICLVGRNGSGKSSLLKILDGSIEPAFGTRFLRPGSTIAALKQSNDFSKFSTLGEYILNDLDELDYHKQKAQLSGLFVSFDKKTASASGGELRRAALIRALILPGDVLLLDEPTNHLDINAIEFLERYLAETSQAVIVISHDRLFLESIGNSLLWIDRGVLHKINKKFSSFEDYRDTYYAREVENIQKLKNKIKKESIWAIEGISGRRKRNQKRLKEFQALKSENSKIKLVSSLPKFKFSLSGKSASLVVEATKISKKYDELQILKNFSFSIRRGDRVAIVGPNGVGKTTLVNLLLKKEAPDSGQVKIGRALNLAVFDQNRDSLSNEISLWNFLSGVEKLDVIGKNDHILVQNKPRHIISYLNDFLFTRDQIYGRIGDLSGGEKSRLLLALLMAKSSNMLVLDEPTNDLDLETLDLLKELIFQYDGTVIFVSHDRDFIDSVASHTLLFKENKSVVIHAGGFSDYAKLTETIVSPEREGLQRKKLKNQKVKILPKRNLNQNLSKKLVAVEGIIEKLDAEIRKLEFFLSNKNLYFENKQKFERISKALVSRQEMLRQAEDEWIRIEELKSDIQ